MGTLYVVPTPIGNLEDITLRALRTLREAGLIAAEDTRVTRKLLARYEIATRLISFHEHNESERTGELLERLEDTDIALVSDAGAPTVSDPGRFLISAAAERGFSVVALPGASAVTTALAASGMDANEFVFIGFLPRRRADRAARLAALVGETRTVVAFESPHRLAASLSDMRETFGDRRIAVCREMTKLHEEVYRGTATSAAARFQKPRGEFTLVIEGASAAALEAAREEAKPDAAALLSDAHAAGMTARDAISAVRAKTGLPRRKLYSLWLSLDN